MPNIKSAIKRVNVIEKKTLRNNMIKSGYKSAVKKFEQAVEAGNVEEATTLFSQATKKIDQACSKGVIVKNTAARKKSNLYSSDMYAKNVLKIYKKVINKDTNVFKKAFHGVKHILEKSGDKKWKKY